MAKRIAVIDIGSNSIRMVIYERTSRFAFHLLHEIKSKVRLSENAYQNDGLLQELPMQKTFDALKDFLEISSSFKARKTLCVATSALRSAPNKYDFLTRVKNKLKLNIKVISGEKEAYLGAIACANLLPSQKNALSIDIGGGSTEFAFIDGNKVSNTISLDLGTVRLKELYFDNEKTKEAIAYIDDKLTVLEDFSISTIIGIGGSFRAIASALMKSTDYPLNKLHAYECLPQDIIRYINNILQADETELKKLGIKKNRFDIIKPGALILQRVFMKFNVEKIITSGVGVREGVYLSDLLRNNKHVFPHNYNTSIKYILDANIVDTNYSNNLSTLSKRLFDLLHDYLELPLEYRSLLSQASKLYPTGSNIHYYSQNRNTYHLIKSALEYGFTHSQIMLIATLTRYASNKPPSGKHLKKYTTLLPKSTIVYALSHILSISIALLSHKPRNIDFDISFEKEELKIASKNTLYLSKEAIKKIGKTPEINSFSKIFVP